MIRGGRQAAAVAERLSHGGDLGNSTIVLEGTARVNARAQALAKLCSSWDAAMSC
jgi:hypothetical protein